MANKSPPAAPCVPQQVTCCALQTAAAEGTIWALSSRNWAAIAPRRRTKHWLKAIALGNDADVTGGSVVPTKSRFRICKLTPKNRLAALEILHGRRDSSYGGNVKDFEILVSDELPVGGFRSIGKFTAQNLRVIKSPYQEFTFPETTAKYLKIKVLSNYGGSPLGNTFLKQIRLIRRPAT